MTSDIWPGTGLSVILASTDPACVPGWRSINSAWIREDFAALTFEKDSQGSCVLALEQSLRHPQDIFRSGLLIVDPDLTLAADWLESVSEIHSQEQLPVYTGRVSRHVTEQELGTTTWEDETPAAIATHVTSWTLKCGRPGVRSARPNPNLVYFTPPHGVHVAAALGRCSTIDEVIHTAIQDIRLQLGAAPVGYLADFKSYR